MVPPFCSLRGKMVPPTPKIRLNLDITEQVRDRLLKLQQKSEASSFVEVIRRALALYEMVSDGDCKIMKSDLSAEIRIL